MNKTLKETVLSNRQKTSSLNGWYVINAVFAKLLLDLNVANYRNLRTERIAAIAKEMTLGKWKKNGEPIVINKEGILQDGQHRLHAVVKSNCSIVAYIIFDAEITDVYDLNMPRNLKTIFNAEGTTISNLSIGGGKMLLRYGSKSENHGYVTQHDYILDRITLLKKCENIISSGCSTRSIIKPVTKKAGCLAIVYCLLKTGEVSEADMREFFRIANSGNDVGCTKPASPALMCRNQLLACISNGGGRTPQKIHLELTYRALCEFKHGNIVINPYSYDTDDAVRLIQRVYEMENIANAA